MATRCVPLEFHCDKRKFAHYHDIPSSLVKENIATDSGYLDAFSSAILPLVSLHKEECMAASDVSCNACRARPTTTVLMSPVSYLHKADNPLVVVLVKPICHKKSCDEAGKRETQAMMNEAAKRDCENNNVHGEAAAHGPAGDAERGRVLRNAVCPCGSDRKYKKCCGGVGKQSDEA